MNVTNESQKSKNLLTQIIRHIIQIASFILFPGLFILIWNSIGGIYQALISGTFSFSSMASQILILVAVIPITILWGRFFCGYLCAFGGMQELLNFVAKKLKIKQIQVPKNIDKYMKYIKYAVGIVIIALWTANISLGTASPWNVFGIYSSYKGWTDLSSFLTLGGFILLLIVISSLFVERVFCRYFCPLGGIFTLISKPRLYKIKKNSYKCVNCNMCSKYCAMNIDVNKETTEYGKVKSGECIDCFKCIDVCKPCALYTNPKEAISGTVASIAIAGLYYGGTIATGNQYSVDNVTNTTSISQGKYTDGTYEGSGQGYRGTTTVQVKVSNGNITSITIESYKDDDQFFNKAKSTIINEIISAQSTDVSTVSGATYSSKGIISAVANALNINENSTTTSNTSSATNTATNTTSGSNSTNNSNTTTNTNTSSSSNNNVSSSSTQASTSTSQSTSSSSSSSTSTNTNTNSSSSSSTSFSSIADGTYTGTGTGRNGSIKVSVVVKSGKVTSITIESYVDDEQYFSRAKSTIINEIISAQSINVSTVSGATMSSNGIIDAVANALGISYTNPNSSIQSSMKGKH